MVKLAHQAPEAGSLFEEYILCTRMQEENAVQ
jgi:hypothetical protein